MTRYRRRLWTALSVPAATLTLLAAGCESPATSGGAGSSRAPASASAGAPAGAGAGAADWRAWAQCMRDHGVAMPDLDPRTGEVVGSGERPDKHAPGFGEAVQACAGREPAGTEDRNAPLTPAELEQKRQWATCMRDNGVLVPDPDPNDPNGPHFERLPNMPPAAVLDRALGACRDQLPARIRDDRAG